MKWDLIDSERGRAESAQRKASFETAIAEIAGFRLLPLNWDSYGGKPASERAIGFCPLLLQDVRDHSELGPPLIRPISTGIYLLIFAL